MDKVLEKHYMGVWTLQELNAKGISEYLVEERFSKYGGVPKSTFGLHADVDLVQTWQATSLDIFVDLFHATLLCKPRVDWFSLLVHLVPIDESQELSKWT
jgi:hypothetical protein